MRQKLVKRRSRGLYIRIWRKRCQKSCLKRGVVFHHGGLSSWQSSQRPFTKVVFHQSGLSSGRSFTKVIFHHVLFHQGGIFYVFHQGGLSPKWSFIKVIVHQGGLSSRWSFTKVVFYQSGLSSRWLSLM